MKERIIQEILRRSGYFCRLFIKFHNALLLQVQEKSNFERTFYQNHILYTWRNKTSGTSTWFDNWNFHPIVLSNLCFRNGRDAFKFKAQVKEKYALKNFFLWSRKVLEKIQSIFPHSFDGRPFSYAEVKLIEDMDSFAVKELIFKMFELHNIQSSQDVKILAKHNVSRLIGLYQALVWKVCMLFTWILWKSTVHMLGEEFTEKSCFAKLLGDVWV